MSADGRHVCIVCGRKFPSGQGVVIKIGNELFEFHSNRCFAKFARILLERLPQDEVRGYVKRLKDEFDEALVQKSKSKSKKL